MRKLLAVTTMVCASACFPAQAQTAQAQTTQAKAKKVKKTTATTATTADTVTIPKDAVLGEDGSYRYTDKQGKKWLYRKTPFGVSKVADDGAKPAAQGGQQQAAAGPELTKATVVGNTVKFERPTAFGVTRWEKKTSELTDDEKKVLQNQKANQE